jgi:hypothetical protein
VAPSALAGIVYVGVDSAGCGVVTGTRSGRLPSLAEALRWCDELGLQVLNRDELAWQLADLEPLPVEVE